MIDKHNSTLTNMIFILKFFISKIRERQFYWNEKRQMYNSLKYKNVNSVYHNYISATKEINILTKSDSILCYLYLLLAYSQLLYD